MKIGTYILIVRLGKKREIRVGKLGAFPFRMGYYFYIGSAFGPGGLNARISRHYRQQKKRHWHIDYLTSEDKIIDVWFSDQEKKHECGWANILEGVSELQYPVPGFGATDCSCLSHLFYSRKKPLFEDYRKLLRSGLARWSPCSSKP